MKLKIISVFGTRPEAIKMAPLVKELEKYPDRIESKVLVTAQHREMLDQVLELFKIKPDIDLDLMIHGQSLEELTGRVITETTKALKQEKPHLVLVHGDTTTTMGASLAAFYAQAKVGHVEAGLRTDNKFNPYPEEMNRRVTTVLADLHFGPTDRSVQNLLHNGVNAEAIFKTGNTVIDALLQVAQMDIPFPLGEELAEKFPGKKLILVTTHRRENWGQPLEQICTALKELLDEFPDTALILPMHKNPVVRKTVKEVLGSHSRVLLIEPLDYLPFVQLMKLSHLILTDSGGVQEEGPSLGKPILVLRNTTERPEAVEAGTVELVGTSKKKIVGVASRLLKDRSYYDAMSHRINPYGDGKACPRIVEAILKKAEEGFFG